jgi:DnaK suppressor protein
MGLSLDPAAAEQHRLRRRNEGTTTVDQQRARVLIEAERERVRRLLGDVAEAEVADRKGADEPSDFGEQGQRLTAQGTDELVADSLRERLVALDRAEQRMEHGTYGRSTRSGKPIPDERLEADPAAELTVEEAEASQA